MAVIWIKQSLKKRNEVIREKQTAKEQITEIQDALIEIAEMVSELMDDTAGGDNDG